MDKAASTGTLTNPAKLNAFLKAATKAVTVDEDFSLIDMALQFRSLRGDNLDVPHQPAQGQRDDRRRVGRGLRPGEGAGDVPGDRRPTRWPSGPRPTSRPARHRRTAADRATAAQALAARSPDRAAKFAVRMTHGCGEIGHYRSSLTCGCHDTRGNDHDVAATRTCPYSGQARLSRDRTSTRRGWHAGPGPPASHAAGRIRVRSRTPAGHVYGADPGVAPAQRHHVRPRRGLRPGDGAGRRGDGQHGGRPERPGDGPAPAAAKTKASASARTRSGPGSS